MRKIILPLFAVAAALYVTGCASPEEKLARGISNVHEAVRLGDMRRTIEQTSVIDSPSEGATLGLIRGFDRSVSRVGVGIYEVVTFPFPLYRPVLTKYLTPEPVYPDSYKPGLLSDTIFETDTYAGFSGGDIAPFLPGSRFKVFDNN